MASQQTVVTAFVASPGDVSEERSVLQEVVNELNLTWSKTLGVRLELLRWETHTFPSVGEYPQEVINRQIGDDYDIFIGIMWKRFGTTTPNYDSGTEEEFERAYNRYRTEPRTVEIMFYFKDAPVPPSQIDLPQIQKVLEFKKKLGNEGTYHWSFTDREQFRQFLRVHLSRIIQRWKMTGNNTSSTASGPGRPTGLQSSAPTALESAEAEELGLFDHIELGQKSFQNGEECAAHLAYAIVEVGGAMSLRNEQINALIARGTPDVQGVKRVANLTAEDLTLFASRIEAELPLFSSTYRKGLDHLTAAANVAVEDFSPKRHEVLVLREAIATHAPTLDQLTIRVDGMRQSIVRLPRLHSGFNKAKRKAANVLEKLMAEITFSKQVGLDAVKLLDDVLTRIPE